MRRTRARGRCLSPGRACSSGCTRAETCIGSSWRKAALRPTNTRRGWRKRSSTPWSLADRESRRRAAAWTPTPVPAADSTNHLDALAQVGDRRACEPERRREPWLPRGPDLDALLEVGQVAGQELLDPFALILVEAL